jgi:hypothetical protein
VTEPSTDNSARFAPSERERVKEVLLETLNRREIGNDPREILKTVGTPFG